MTYKEVFNKTIKYYPSEINISDGKNVEKGNGNFKKLTESWNNAELKSKNDSNIIKLMVWAIFRTYHKTAIENFLSGIKTVSASDLEMKYLKSSFEESLMNLNISLN